MAWMLLLTVALLLAALSSCAAGRADAPRPPAPRRPIADEFPQQTIANDALALHLALPDARRGYYRARRFDPSGMVLAAECAGHRYFAPLYLDADPLRNDNVGGTTEEFDMHAPPGYAGAKPGQPFLKIAIGTLRRADDAAYDFSAPYELSQPAAWDIDSGRDWIEFRQDFAADGWSYRYVKRVALTPGRPEFSIAHALTNAGPRALTTTPYAHNFLIVDDEPIGPDYAGTLPFRVPSPVRLGRGEVEVRDETVRICEPLTDAGMAACLDGWRAGDAAHNAFTARNTRTGAGIEVRGDAPLTTYRLYAVRRALCPELFTRFDIPPGRQARWTYTFRLLA
ncbi:MAG TPA: hypothetical protein PK082_08075 [Phycisphaerae bacterium]|nr:hypothetical protein [Phycisphaerae bacterium]